jgi:7-carboxy-7-deazaguanine synthase
VGKIVVMNKAVTDNLSSSVIEANSDEANLFESDLSQPLQIKSDQFSSEQITSNKIASALLESGLMEYRVVETFHSIQGEGAWMGASAFFIRLAGCDVKCPWCDTKESWNALKHRKIPTNSLAKMVREADPAIAVITGGEPLMHDLSALCNGINPGDSKNIRLHLETSGAYPLTGKFDWITLSPKTFKPPVADIYGYADELKVVVSDRADLDWAICQEQLVDASGKSILKYLQPEWNSPESQAMVFDFILQNPQWRLSLQTHKLLGVR